MPHAFRVPTTVVLCALGLAGCLEKMDLPPGDAADADSACAAAECESDPEQDAPEAEGDPDPLYLERARAGLEAWSLELSGENLRALRTLGDDVTAHNPAHWITVADDSCAAEGIGEGLRADCPLNDEVIGVCETRYYPDTGEIVDTTLVVFDAFQEGEAPEADKIAVFVHEIGHCLGLRHSDDEEHVMYPTTAGADMPGPHELVAVAAAYLPTPQAPPAAVAEQYFAQSSMGATVRIPVAPVFTISGAMGTETDRSFEPPPAGAKLRAGVVVARHEMRRDGGCRDHQ